MKGISAQRRRGEKKGGVCSSVRFTSSGEGFRAAAAEPPFAGRKEGRAQHLQTDFQALYFASSMELANLCWSDCKI